MISVQVNEKLGHLSEEFQNSNHSLSAEVEKYGGGETQHKWKSEGNIQQFIFNLEIICDFDRVLWDIEYDKIEYCKDVVSEANEKVL
jgi:hypothetical protein